MIETRWDADGVIRYSCFGTVQIQDFVATLRTTVEDERYASTRASIWDLRGGQFTVSYCDQKAFASVFLNILDTPKVVRKVAWVVQFMTLAAIVDLYYREYEWPAEWRTFSQYEEAESWCLSF